MSIRQSIVSIIKYIGNIIPTKMIYFVINIPWNGNIECCRMLHYPTEDYKAIGYIDNKIHWLHYTYQIDILCCLYTLEWKHGML